MYALLQQHSFRLIYTYKAEDLCETKKVGLETCFEGRTSVRHKYKGIISLGRDFNLNNAPFLMKLVGDIL